MWVIRGLILSLGILVYGAQPALACTLFAAHGDRVAGGGTLIVKNRDSASNHHQKIKVINSNDGYSYMGLVAEGVDGNDNRITYSPVKAGVNEQGLVLTYATASSLPREQRDQEPFPADWSHRVLSENASVDEVIANFSNYAGIRILLIADAEKIARIEKGPDGKVDIKITSNGAEAVTNFYQSELLQPHNEKLFGDKRLQAANDLLAADQKHDRKSFENLSHQIWRKGPKMPTRSAFMVRLRPGHAPQVTVTFSHKEGIYDRMELEYGHKLKSTCDLSLSPALSPVAPTP